MSQHDLLLLLEDSIDKSNKTIRDKEIGSISKHAKKFIEQNNHIVRDEIPIPRENDKRFMKDTIN